TGVQTCALPISRRTDQHPSSTTPTRKRAAPSRVRSRRMWRARANMMGLSGARRATCSRSAREWVIWCGVAMSGGFRLPVDGLHGLAARVVVHLRDLEPVPAREADQIGLRGDAVDAQVVGDGAGPDPG